MQIKTALALATLALAATAGHASQGVSKDEILLGSIQDLSGPIAGFWQTSSTGHVAGGR